MRADLRRRQRGDSRRRHGLRRGALVVLALALLVPAAWGRGRADSGGAGAGPAPADLPQVGDFEIIAYQSGAALGGERVQFSDVLARGKPVVLNFWAGLCPPCRAEMPEFQEVYDQYADRILLLGIDLGPFTGLGTTEQGRALLEELGVTYPAGTTEDAAVLSSFQVLGMPTTMFVTPDGGITHKWTGILTRDKLVELTRELLAAAER